MQIDRLLMLETAVWEALRVGDAEADRALLADDFLGVYPSGFAGRDDHVGQLAGGAVVHEYALHEPRLLALTDDHLLLSYRAVFRRRAGGDSETQLISSLWSRVDGRWRNVFSQDTPAV